MTTNTSRALLAAVFLATSALVAVPAYAASLSDAVQRHLSDAQAAAKKGDWVGAKTAVDAAMAYGGRSAYDDYEIARMAIAVDVNNKDMEGAAKAAQTVADSASQSDKDKVNNANVAPRSCRPAKRPIPRSWPTSPTPITSPMISRTPRRWHRPRLTPTRRPAACRITTPSWSSCRPMRA